jgi:hypothetical protein
MTYFSMFSGIGGFEIPLQELGFECIGFSEIDKYAVQVYKSHFINHHNYGNATSIIASELPDFDLLVGGFPCQAFSIAGKRRGFDDTRGTLFFDVARILKEKRPRFFILENVKGLLSHDNGRTFKVIIATLAANNPDVFSQLTPQDQQDLSQGKVTPGILTKIGAAANLRQQRNDIAQQNADTANQRVLIAQQNANVNMSRAFGRAIGLQDQGVADGTATYHATGKGTPNTSGLSSKEIIGIKKIIAAHPGQYGHAAEAIDAQYGKGTATKADDLLKSTYLIPSDAAAIGVNAPTNMTPAQYQAGLQRFVNDHPYNAAGAETAYKKYVKAPSQSNKIEIK